MIPVAAALHGRLHILDREAAVESTGHGSPLPSLKHGGPGRAGGGEELGGMRAVRHLMQRTALQGSPKMIAAVTGEYMRGAQLIETEVHPFRRHFEDLQIGESLLTHRRTVCEADIVAFGGLSGDYFYMHLTKLQLRTRHSVSASRMATSCCRRPRVCCITRTRSRVGQLWSGHPALREASGYR